MKIYQKAKFVQNKNVVACILKATVRIDTAHGYHEDFVTVTRGIAKCAPQDEFDLRKGMMIAESRATLKLLKRAVTLHKKELKEAYHNVSLIEKNLEKLKTMSITESVHYDSLV
jgi:hypothetical protein